MRDLEKLEKRIIECRRCPQLRVNPYPFPHVLYGNNPKVLIVGRNPGIEHDYAEIEDKEEYLKIYYERFWVCNVGKYLRKRLSDEFIKNHVIFTNICKCASPNNRAPTYKEIGNCSSYLMRLIKIVSPKIIISLGAQPSSRCARSSRRASA